MMPIVFMTPLYVTTGGAFGGMAAEMAPPPGGLIARIVHVTDAAAF
jgi:hypothetical protein